jgi:lipopolysaccharide cholinephosphotransferase
MDKNLREHQLEAVEALKLVDEVCQNYNIQYFMIAGSTLGAIRHKGFIPWDDDVDIVMTMDNYHKFLKIAPREIGKKYIWMDTSVDENFPTLSGRILLTEDEQLLTVFPLVKLSDNALQRKSQWMIRKIFSPVWQRKVGYEVPEEELTGKKKFSIFISKILSVFFSKKAVLHILRWNEMRFEEKDVQWYCNIYSKYTLEKESIKSEWVKELVRVPFEDGEFPIVKNYDAYLTHLYGDYMTPPQEKDRVPVHI